MEGDDILGGIAAFFLFEENTNTGAKFLLLPLSPLAQDVCAYSPLLPSLALLPLRKGRMDGESKGSRMRPARTPARSALQSATGSERQPMLQVQLSCRRELQDRS